MNFMTGFAEELLEKHAISKKLVERVTSRALQNESFRGIDRTGERHATQAKKIRKQLHSSDLSPEQMRALANTEANHIRINEIASKLKEGRTNALAGKAEDVAAALPRPHTPPHLGKFEIPHVNGRKLLMGAGAAGLAALAVKALMKRKETEQGYEQPY